MNIPDHISECLETLFWVKNTSIFQRVSGSGMRSLFDPRSLLPLLPPFYCPFPRLFYPFVFPPSSPLSFLPFSPFSPPCLAPIFIVSLLLPVALLLRPVLSLLLPFRSLFSFFSILRLHSTLYRKNPVLNAILLWISLILWLDHGSILNVSNKSPFTVLVPVLKTYRTCKCCGSGGSEIS